MRSYAPAPKESTDRSMREPNASGSKVSSKQAEHHLHARYTVPSMIRSGVIDVKPSPRKML